MKAWLLTSPSPQSHWYETWRFMDEMKNRNLNAMHVHPYMCTLLGDKLYVNKQKTEIPDLVIMRHAVWNTNGLKKLGELRNLGTIFVTDIEPHIEALDKVCAHKKYVKANIPLPKTLIIDIFDDTASEQINNFIGYPCVIKWRFAAGSEKVFLCQDEFELHSIAGNMLRSMSSVQFASRLSFDSNINSKENTTVVVQEYIDMNYMITAHTIRGRNIQATMQAIPPSFTGYSKFKANFANAEGRVQLPIEACGEIQNMVNSALDALEIEWGRVDIFPTKDGLKLCEVNPSANFPMTEACSLRNLAGHMVDHAIDKYQSLKR